LYATAISLQKLYGCVIGCTICHGSHVNIAYGSAGGGGDAGVGGDGGVDGAL
jgi:hypothetical protein